MNWRERQGLNFSPAVLNITNLNVTTFKQTSKSDSDSLSLPLLIGELVIRIFGQAMLQKTGEGWEVVGAGEQRLGEEQLKAAGEGLETKSPVNHKRLCF